MLSASYLMRYYILHIFLRTKVCIVLVESARVSTRRFDFVSDLKSFRSAAHGIGLCEHQTSAPHPEMPYKTRAPTTEVADIGR